MNKEKQDLLWSVLSKEARGAFRTTYVTNCGTHIDYCEERAFILNWVFGEHNLTSDTEPEEMLIVSATKVRGYYDIAKTASRNKEYAQGVSDVLFSLFGNKCLPDEEPKTKSKETKETQNLSLSDEQSTENKEPMEEKEFGKEDNFPTKELNLCELLKGCENTEFYSLMHGKVRFMTIGADGFVMFDLPESISVYDNGKYDLNAEVIIYPSRALYEKYPLDAYSAWMEWKEARKPKRWRAGICESYWRVNVMGDAVIGIEHNTDVDNGGYNFGNYFRTEEEAKQAVDAIRETLAKFHELNSEK